MKFLSSWHLEFSTFTLPYFFHYTPETQPTAILEKLFSEMKCICPSPDVYHQVVNQWHSPALWWCPNPAWPIKTTRVLPGLSSRGRTKHKLQTNVTTGPKLQERQNRFFLFPHLFVYLLTLFSYKFIYLFTCFYLNGIFTAHGPVFTPYHDTLANAGLKVLLWGLEFVLRKEFLSS